MARAGSPPAAVPRVQRYRLSVELAALGGAENPSNSVSGPRNPARLGVLTLDGTAPAARIACAAAAPVGAHQLNAVIGPGEGGLGAVLDTATEQIGAGRHFRQREQRTEAR